MDLTSKFLAFTLLGAEWVLWLLIVLSVLSVAVMIERFLYLLRRKVDLDRLIKGLREAPRGPGAASEAMISARSRQRHLLERRIAFLGTLGNNAPFIGLFGTVIGVILAFEQLGQASAATGATSQVASA